jgi:DNA-directed RNA polymerase specialized sigma24 family protein
VREFTPKFIPTDAAAELGIPEGNLKSRLLAAKRALLALAEPLLAEDTAWLRTRRGSW